MRVTPRARHGPATCCAMLASWAIVSAAAGCEQNQTPPAPPAPSAGLSPATRHSGSAAQPRKVQGRPIPSGPALAILAGKGVGPIRIGATVETIQRHMARPCDVLTEQVCRYVGRAVEFHLRDGKVASVRVHRPYRPADGSRPDGQPLRYGIFNGGIPPDVRFGMHIPGVQVALGKPTRVEQVNDPLFGTRELHYYPGMILEYDQLPSAPLVLGGVRVVPK
jgi:hypothetical protein